MAALPERKFQGRRRARSRRAMCSALVQRHSLIQGRRVQQQSYTCGCPCHFGLQEETGVPCECNEQVGEMLRGVRQHFAT